jgi:glycosyltransferase involved in cell wall biosynthesis
MILKKLIVVIPTRNEENTIESVIKQIPRNLAKNTKIVIIDKSNDTTPFKAEKAGALVIKQPSGGLGTAFRLGIKTGIKLDADILMHVDGDFQYDPKEMPSLLRPILSGEADMVLGRRLLHYRMPIIRRVGNKFFSWLVSKCTSIRISDAQTGYRALNRRALKILSSLKEDYTYTQESIVVGAKNGLRIREVPIVFRKRLHGCSFVNIFFYPIKVLGIIVRAYFREL